MLASLDQALGTIDSLLAEDGEQEEPASAPLGADPPAAGPAADQG